MAGPGPGSPHSQVDPEAARPCALRRVRGARSDMIAIRPEKPADIAARETLLDVAYGASRFAKPSERLREGREPALSLVASEHGRLVGTIRLWPVSAGAGRPALRAARVAGHRALVLVGDAAYYGRFGFTAAGAGALSMPGQVERDRLLALELAPAALAGARGRILAGDVGRPARR